MILQADIGGYNARPATVIGFLDFDTGMLFIKRTGKMVGRRYSDDTGYISNQPVDDCDYLFSEQDFSEAFKAYKHYSGCSKLVFDNSAKRATPTVEIKEITENGSKYAVYGDISNEEMGVIALCFMARQASAAQSALDTDDGLYKDERVEHIDIFTI